MKKKIAIYVYHIFRMLLLFRHGILVPRIVQHLIVPINNLFGIVINGPIAYDILHLAIMLESICKNKARIFAPFAVKCIRHLPFLDAALDLGGEKAFLDTEVR